MAKRIRQISFPDLQGPDFFRTWNDTEDYILTDQAFLTQEQYDDIKSNYEDYISTVYDSGNLKYQITNGLKIVNNKKDITVYSPNLINGELCYSLTISGLPGNEFMLNDDAKNIVRINNQGIFSMDFGDYPITSLRSAKPNKYEAYTTTIDIVYQSVEGGEK